ncbi:zinc finger protein 2 homolog [Manduca sexta]|uniref:zinc finger protein 2 homolog n=1 Tax=Manduca sexta TaxID=7130 RepID=UPI00188F0058|nr:zinc finger protein 2 homolog [Manduca sexta]XP_037292661.1 zinc finger protein 2 homolog [Manduca sexta]
MASGMDVNVLVKHLVNGTLGEKLCIICLEQLNESYENIFTKICKEDREYCIADVLETVCQIKFDDETANYNVCLNCFVNASLSYKFFLLSKTSQEIISYYTEQLNQSIDTLPEDNPPSTFCIPLPSFAPKTFSFNFDLDGIGTTETYEMPVKKSVTPKTDDDVVVVVQENGELLFYKILDNGQMMLLDEYERQKYDDVLSKSAKVVGTKKKQRKKRGPMSYKCCTLCPVKYRFVAKLQTHMKVGHNVNLFVCKVCKAFTEDELEYHNHLKTHTNIHQCAHCNTVFKKRDTIIAHLKWHEKMKNIGQSESAHICEICGVILENEQSLTEHWENRHYKKYTCYYCGRMYKGEISFEMHIKKHEQHMEKKVTQQDTPKLSEPEKKSPKQDSKPRCTCTLCGHSFVDQRALMWHQRLHNNERPYSCDECGRAFVSMTRRNQHQVCAHTAPTRRCPLCPALFHLRSMVNTHVKKVHLKAHKRRNRTSKYQNVYWRTEPVPIQELSVSIQNEILEMQAAKENEPEDWVWRPESKMENM